MPRPRDDERINAMYAHYLAGYSLAQVAKAFGVSRQSVYEAFALRSFKLRDKPEPLPFVMYKGRKYTIKKQYGYYSCTSGDRARLHRVMWADAHGPIPEGMDIHHRNGDKTDNRLGNLELITKSKHSSKYPNCQNQYTKARRLAVR